MLPLVGIIAIGLLLVAGKLFFLTGLQPDKPPLPVIASPPPAVTQEKPAQAGTEVKVQEGEARSGRPAPDIEKPEERRPLATLDVLAVPYGSDAGTMKNEKAESAPAVTAVTQERPKKQPLKVSPPKAQAVKVVVVPDKKEIPPQPKAPQKPPSWMVQVGAFSTRAAADVVQQQMVKAGYTTNIISGKTLHRVLVQAGATRDEALEQASRISRSGFQGAFIVPPRQ